MRNEATIRQKVEKMRASRCARFYATEIAALEWALADCPSIDKRKKEVHRQYGKPTLESQTQEG